MKKRIVLFAALLVVGTSSAQQLTNNGFEDWNNYGAYEDPEGWITFNPIVLLGGPATIVKSSDAHSGSFALESKTMVADIGGSGNLDTIQGIGFLGTLDLNTDETTPGMSFAYRPDSLVGWYKLTTPNNVPCMINCILSNWNNNQQEDVGIAVFVGEGTTSYQRFSIPIGYTSNATPDTITMVILNALDNTMGIDNILLLDDLEFIYNSTPGITEKQSFYSISPNPATDAVTVQCTSQPISIELLDMNGRKVLTVEQPSMNTAIALGDLTPGVFICQVISADGTIHQERIVKK